MSDLETLAQNHEVLLLAEVAAWLHDASKHTDQHIHTWVQNAPSLSGTQDINAFIPRRQVTLLGRRLDFSLIRNRRRDDFCDGYLNRCHYTAHIEKEDGDGPQRYPSYVSSPFGYERANDKIPDNLTTKLHSQISWHKLSTTPFTHSEQSGLRVEIKRLFSRVGGDTRRPANEITLWEWGHTVGALYKAALAGALLGFQPTANSLRWRLLSIRFDGHAYLTTVSGIPDLLARKTLLDKAFERVRQLLEEEYPLGTEVYRDENGSLYVVPGCEKGNCQLEILKCVDKYGISLGDLIRRAIQGSGSHDLAQEMIPVVNIDLVPWWGQDPNRQGNDELPPIVEHLEPVSSAPSPQWVAEQWQNRTAEICTVCGLRPQGPSDKAKARGVCNICEERRADRAKAWVADLSTTIWLDEVADINGRLALIVGQFDLIHWLNGTLVRTLGVTNPAAASVKTADAVAKNPSFARIRRIWEATRRFWQQVLPTYEDRDVHRSLMGQTNAACDARPSDHVHRSLVGQTLGQVATRLEIKGKLQSQEDNKTPGLYHVYDLLLTRSVKLSVVWDPQNGRFMTADNLSYLAKPEQLGQPVKTWLEGQKDHRLTLEEPTGYRIQNNVWGHIQIENVQEVPNSAYTPAIPILAEPRTFMALVPADKALDIMQAIKEKYEREMGKVRNRLPLHLGVVYFHRRTPLRAALDAGRRMLQQKPLGGDQTWTVRADTALGTLPNEKQALADGTRQFQQTIKVQLEQDNWALKWYVPAVMGDGDTPDNWYPYVFVETNGDDNKVNGRTLAFKGQRPVAAGTKECWLIHASELKAGDQVYFTPATFDFEWLDTSARRFEIAYDAQGKRYGRLARPYLLGDLNDIQQSWRLIAGPNGLTISQIHALRETIETRREVWQNDPDDDTFRQLCRQAIRNAEWGQRPSKDGDIDKQLTDWAISGLLADTIELYMEIIKVKPKRDDVQE